MNLTTRHETYGEPYVLATGGLLIGLFFGEGMIHDARMRKSLAELVGQR